MGIRIRSIRIQDMGPLTPVSLDLGLFNLIYGKNERGKTCIVEFIVRSLFRNARLFNVRGFSGKGHLTLSGLGEKETRFSPGEGKKLEEYWVEDGQGFPLDFSRLLVVKGAETELADSGGGVDKAILRSFLSRQEVLDQIRKGMSPHYEKLEIRAGEILGNKGLPELKRREELKSHLATVGHLIQRVDTDFSSSGRKTLVERRNAIHEELQRMEKAKCFSASVLHRRIEGLRSRKAGIDGKRIQEMRDGIQQLHIWSENIRREEKKEKEAAAHSKNVKWLAAAAAEYEKTLGYSRTGPAGWIFSAAELCLLAAGLFLSLINQKIAGVIALAMAAAAVCLHFFVHRRLFRHAPLASELARIQESYLERYQTPLKDVAQLREKREEEERHFRDAELIRQGIEEQVNKAETLKSSLEDRIRAFYGRKAEIGEWEALLAQSGSEIEKLDREMREAEKQLATLDVDPADYSETDPGVPFSKDAYKRLKLELQDAEQAVRESEGRLDELKNEIRQFLGPEHMRDWDTGIASLSERNREWSGEFRKVTAELLAKKVVYDVLRELAGRQDEKIAQGLESPDVLQPLKAITGRYTGLSLQDDTLYVSDEYDRFPLSELSTGAQEQVLLALRTGFATRLLRQDSLFLILDDAFQYSDWERREWLVGMAADLAAKGWQILYLTMDDHIREVFRKRGKVFKDEYREFDLEMMTSQEKKRRHSPVS